VALAAWLGENVGTGGGIAVIQPDPIPGRPDLSRVWSSRPPRR
jgi:hypothetical protein